MNTSLAREGCMKLSPPVMCVAERSAAAAGAGASGSAGAAASGSAAATGSAAASGSAAAASGSAAASPSPTAKRIETVGAYALWLNTPAAHHWDKLKMWAGRVEC